jgi:hypothetical protein
MLRFEDAHRLLAADDIDLPSGVWRLPNGVVHVAVLTRMPEVRPGMIQWWFEDYMRTTEHYRRWHPRDHVWMDWENKRPGTMDGAAHLVHEYIGGRLRKLRIAFVAPEEFLGEEVRQRDDVRALCARAGMLERPVDLARMAHVAIARDWGTELHSHFWMGYVAARTDSGWFEPIANLPAVRRRTVSLAEGRALENHCHEEMTFLAGFLPELFAAETGERL